MKGKNIIWKSHCDGPVVLSSGDSEQSFQNAKAFSYFLLLAKSCWSTNSKFLMDFAVRVCHQFIFLAKYTGDSKLHKLLQRNLLLSESYSAVCLTILFFWLNCNNNNETHINLAYIINNFVVFIILVVIDISLSLKFAHLLKHFGETRTDATPLSTEEKWDNSQ